MTDCQQVYKDAERYVAMADKSGNIAVSPKSASTETSKTT